MESDNEFELLTANLLSQIGVNSGEVRVTELVSRFSVEIATLRQIGWTWVRVATALNNFGFTDICTAHTVSVSYARLLKKRKINPSQSLGQLIDAASKRASLGRMAALNGASGNTTPASTVAPEEARPTPSPAREVPAAKAPQAAPAPRVVTPVSPAEQAFTPPVVSAAPIFDTSCKASPPQVESVSVVSRQSGHSSQAMSSSNASKKRPLFSAERPVDLGEIVIPQVSSPMHEAIGSYMTQAILDAKLGELITKANNKNSVPCVIEGVSRMKCVMNGYLPVNEGCQHHYSLEPVEGDGESMNEILHIKGEDIVTLGMVRLAIFKMAILNEEGNIHIRGSDGSKLSFFNPSKNLRQAVLDLKVKTVGDYYNTI